MVEGSTFDLIVIGGGSAGLAMARKAAAYEKKVCLIEKHELGGTCVNVGCVPKKMMYAAAEIHSGIKLAEDYGMKTGDVSMDWKLLRDKRDAKVKSLNKIFEGHLESNKITFIRGKATFLAPKEIEVDEGAKKSILKADHVCIATGSISLMPRWLPGLEYCINSDGFFELEKLPKSVFLIGGGYIGIEISGILNNFGVKCTACMMEPNVVWPFDREITKALMEHYDKQGIDILPEVKVQKVEKLGEKQFRVSMEGHDPVEAELIICAMGRVPNYEGLGHDKIGLKMNRFFIDADEFENTSIPGVYCIGDVGGKLMLTPVAVAAGRKLADRLFGGMPESKMDYDLIPSVVFAHPPMGKIGLIEEEAVEKYGKDKIKVYKSKFNSLYYSLTEKKEPTLMKLITVLPEEKIVGLHAMGKGIDEMMQGFAVAIKMGATKKDFDSCVAIHPTSSEEFVTMK